jgi:hypothetical protein
MTTGQNGAFPRVIQCRTQLCNQRSALAKKIGLSIPPAVAFVAAEPKVQKIPEARSVLEYLRQNRWKPMTVIRGGQGPHAASLACLKVGCQTHADG